MVNGTRKAEIALRQAQGDNEVQEMAEKRTESTSEQFAWRSSKLETTEAE